MDSSEDAENINHLQCCGELQGIASAVGQMDTLAAEHGQQGKVPAKTYLPQ